MSRVGALLVGVGLLAGACGDSASSPASAEPEPTPDVDDITSTDAPALTADDGTTIELLGWSRWPFADVAEGVVSLGIDGARPPSALRVEVCAGNDQFNGQASAFSFGDAAGEPFESPSTSIIDPLVSPELLDWPEAGECATGWVQPNSPAESDPATALWGLEVESRWTERLGDPYVGVDHPIDGELLDVGTAIEVDDGATWAVFGVERIPAASPDATIPADAPVNAGAPLDQPPQGTEWAVVDAEYCFGADPLGIAGNIGLVIDGWATGVALSADIAASEEHLPLLLTGEEPCLRRGWVAPVPLDATITAVTSTFGDGPWWGVSD